MKIQSKLFIIITYALKNGIIKLGVVFFLNLNEMVIIDFWRVVIEP
jgi:hypothetical protein